MPIRSKDLGRFYGEYRQQLFTCALVITYSPSQAEDAVHEAFCRLLRNDHNLADLKAYVFRAVRNAALDVVRRARHSPEPLDWQYFPEVTLNQKDKIVCWLKNRGKEGYTAVLGDLRVEEVTKDQLPDG